MSRDLAEPDLSGSLVGGRYLMVRRIGRGGMGVVYQASDLEGPHEVAIKVLARERADSRRHGDRFQREIEALQRVSHPNTVEILGCGRTDRGDLWFAMELVRGTTLSRLARAPQPAARIEAIVRQMLQALHAIHGAGLVHRDLKPANIMVDDGPDGPLVKVLDFGVLRFTDPYRSVLTAQNTLLGTPAFIAPEIIRGEAIDARSDLYAVGICLHAMATGELPFPGSDNNAVLRAQLREEPPPVEPLRGEPLPPPLEALRVALLRKLPSERPQSASEAIGILDGVAQPRATRWRPNLTIAVGLGAALGLTVGLALLAVAVLWLGA
jgi:serine/threonine-protein kinase